MSRPDELLTVYAAALDRAGGDGDSLRRARDLLSLLPVHSADAVAKRLTAIDLTVAERHTKPDAKVVSMRDALSAIAAILESVNRTPRWLTAYLDILRDCDAICWADLTAHIKQAGRQRAVKNTKPGAKMSDQEFGALAKELGSKLTDESWDLNGGSAAFAMLDSPSITKPLAVAIARELLGITHRSKADAITAIKNWYRHRRGAKASLEEIGASANTH